MNQIQEIILLFLDIDRVRDFVNFNNTREFEVVAEIDGLEILSMSMYAKKLFYRIKE